MEVVITQTRALQGQVRVPADKSISHRAVMLAALAVGESRVRNFLRAADTLATIRCMRSLGVSITEQDNELIIEGRGREGLQSVGEALDCGNSGTTMRLLAGLLSGCPFPSVLTGDESLCARPMGRVIEPLRQMGAVIAGRDGGQAPFSIRGGGLQGIDYELPVASAQVKSAILLAGLAAKGPTVVREPISSRDHTERMLAGMGADLTRQGAAISLRPGGALQPLDFRVPGDISSAAYWLVAATLVSGSEVLIPHVGVNPTRSGVIKVLKSMGAEINLENQRIGGGEPVADIWVKAAPLVGTEVGGSLIPLLIDEIPVLAVAMTMARGESVVRDAGELRVKETDRIRVISNGLRRMGADIEELPDGFRVRGGGRLQGCTVDSCGDHRMAMALGIAGLVAEGETVVRNAGVVNISYPDFWQQGTDAGFVRII